MSAFDLAFSFTLAIEGGYVVDDGGPTNHGITQTTYDRYRDACDLPHQPVSLITDAEVSDCYRRFYWIPSHGDTMSPALGVCMFDWAVNHGVDGAIRTLQEACGITADGVYGPHTARAVLSLDNGDLWRELNSLRRAWYRQEAVDEPDHEQYLRGWLYRVDRLDAYCETLEKT